MLVLSRKPGEKIVIGQGAQTILLTVLSIEGRKIRLGIEAPPQVTIYRQELLAPKDNGAGRGR